MAFGRADRKVCQENMLGVGCKQPLKGDRKEVELGNSYQPFERPWICFLKISTGEFLKTAAMQEGAHFRRPPPMSLVSPTWWHSLNKSFKSIQRSQKHFILQILFDLHSTMQYLKRNAHPPSLGVRGPRCM